MIRVGDMLETPFAGSEPETLWLVLEVLPRYEKYPATDSARMVCCQTGRELWTSKTHVDDWFTLVSK